MLYIAKAKNMKKQVIAIPSFVITTIVYALLYPIFLEMDNNIPLREGVNFVVAYDDQNDKTITYSQQQQQQQQQQQVLETECESPCPKSAELCAFMCA
jgi:hypothetical protein